MSVQGPDALLHGPTQRGPACLTPLLPLLRAEAVSPALMPAYTSAWLLMRMVVEVRSDGDAMLARLLLSGTLESALRSSVWQASRAQVRWHVLHGVGAGLCFNEIKQICNDTTCAQAWIMQMSAPVDIQDSSDPQQRALFCKGWLLRIVSLLLLAHNGPSDNPVVHEAVAHLMHTLLLGRASSRSDQQDARTHVGTDTALMSMFDDLDALAACDLSTWWQHRGVRSSTSYQTKLACVCT